MRQGEAVIRNTTPAGTVAVEYGENATFVCTYDGVNPNDEITVTFFKVNTVMYTYKGNATHATVDEVKDDFSHYNLMRVNRGYEQFNMTFQFTNVSALELEYRYYTCNIEGRISSYLQIIVLSSKLIFILF